MGAKQEKGGERMVMSKKKVVGRKENLQGERGGKGMDGLSSLVPVGVPMLKVCLIINLVLAKGKETKVRMKKYALDLF